MLNGDLVFERDIRGEIPYIIGRDIGINFARSTRSGICSIEVKVPTLAFGHVKARL